MILKKERKNKKKRGRKENRKKEGRTGGRNKKGNLWTFQGKVANYLPTFLRRYKKKDEIQKGEY